MTIPRSAPPASPGHGAQAARARAPVPGRACGRCTLCCKTIAVEELAKPAGSACAHAGRGRGCSIYASRPASCRLFHCEWRLTGALGPEWRPDRARFALMVTAAGHLSACVDPAFPAAWRRPPYYRTLRRWAAERAADPFSPWPGIDVWIGRRCILLLPDGEKDLGVVEAEEEVRIERRAGAAGAVWAAEKFRAGVVAG